MGTFGGLRGLFPSRERYLTRKSKRPAAGVLRRAFRGWVVVDALSCGRVTVDLAEVCGEFLHALGVCSLRAWGQGEEIGPPGEGGGGFGNEEGNRASRGEGVDTAVLSDPRWLMLLLATIQRYSTSFPLRPMRIAEIMASKYFPRYRVTHMHGVWPTGSWRAQAQANKTQDSSRPTDGTMVDSPPTRAVEARIEPLRPTKNKTRDACPSQSRSLPHAIAERGVFFAIGDGTGCFVLVIV